jgi:hypothetical protein
MTVEKGLQASAPKSSGRSFPAWPAISLAFELVEQQANLKRGIRGHQIGYLVLRK